MTRNQIIIELKKYFDIQELVCPHTFQKFGEKTSWQFLDTEILHTILILRRDILKVGMICNDYKFGGKHTQRGLRCNICPLCKDKTLKNQIYLTAHANGAGMDFIFGAASGMTAEKARQLIKKNDFLLPYNVRIEKDVTWLHIDCYDTGEKVKEFGV
jgi:hypothetical protein